MSTTIPDSPFLQALQGLSLIPAIQGALEEQGRRIGALMEHLRRNSTRDNDADRWLDAKEAASYLSMCASTFDKYRYEASPKIGGHRIDGKTLYKKSDLDMWVRLYALKSEGRA